MRLLFYLGILFFFTPVSCAKKSKQKVGEAQSITSPAGTNASLPYLFTNTETTLLSWIEEVNDSLVSLRYSELKEGEWLNPTTIVSGSDWFVNWADFPSIVENNGHLFSHILKKSSEGTYSYDVKMNLKRAGTSAWYTEMPLHSDQTPTEHGFVTAIPYQADSFFVTWLDGRNTEEIDGQERGAMTIRAAEVSVKGEIVNEVLLDSRTCDCCQTTAAVTENGPVVIYRDRTENEIRDISIVRLVNSKWTNPVSIHEDNWKINGCPVNGPKAAAIENVLVVAWFTGANEQSAVEIAFSNDNGTNFNAPITIGSDNVIGRVDVVLLDKNTALVSYVESKDKSAQLKVAKINQSGEVSNAKVITEISASRKSGFPQMELVGDKILFAWTDVLSGKSNVRTSLISINDL